MDGSPSSPRGAGRLRRGLGYGAAVTAVGLGLVLPPDRVLAAATVALVVVTVWGLLRPRR